MRIDAHAYMGHWPFRPLRGNTCEALVRRLDENEIDRALVGNINGVFYKNPQWANEELFADCESFLDRLVPFAVLNPTYADWEYDLEICRKGFGMAGVRLYPQYHDYRILGDGCTEAVKRIRDAGMVVSFSSRLVDRRQRSWMDSAEDIPMKNILHVVRQVPDARYLILHAFTPDFANDDVVEAVDGVDIQFDMMYGTATQQIGPVLYDLPTGIAALGPERFSFGTATPFREYPSHVIRMELLESALADPKALAAVWGGNASRLLART